MVGKPGFGGEFGNFDPSLESPSVRVVDAHTHLFPAEIVDDRTAFLERDGWFGELYASPSIVMVSPEAMIASMDAAGIAMSVVCGWPWGDPGLCRIHNDYLASVHARFPDRLAWLAIVNPLDPECASEIARCVDLGACGIGELNADAQGFTWSDPAPLGRMVEACGALELPLLIHCSEPVGHAYPGKGTATPDRILRFLEAWPEIQVVAAHWGGGLPFYEMMPEVARLTANVVYDSAASTYLYTKDIFPVVERLAGSGRIVLGSDYPLLNQKRFLNRAITSSLSETARREVLGGNADRVFNLTGAP